MRYPRNANYPTTVNYPTNPNITGGVYSAATVTINVGTVVSTIASTPRGMNLVTYDDTLLASAASSSMKNIRIDHVRMPGGSYADYTGWNPLQVLATPSAAFPAFVIAGNTHGKIADGVVIPSGAVPYLTINYGSSPTANILDSVTSAANLVANFNKNNVGYTTSGLGGGTLAAAPDGGHAYGVQYACIGNEQYAAQNISTGGKWETNVRLSANTPAVTAATNYANDVLTYAQAIKQIDRSVKVGVCLNWGGSLIGAQPMWNATVLGIVASATVNLTAPVATPFAIDFVDVHIYNYTSGIENDDGLLASIDNYAANISYISKMINQYQGTNNIRIHVGEFSSVASNPGVQSVNQVQAVFMAESVCALLAAGVDIIFPFGLRNYGSVGNASSSLYPYDSTPGYGTFGVTSSGHTVQGYAMPIADSAYPVYRALQLLNGMYNAGDSVVQVVGNSVSFRCYAIKSGPRLNVLLVNRDTSPTTGLVQINGYTPAANWTVLTQSASSPTITTVNQTGLGGAFNWTIPSLGLVLIQM